LQKKCILSIQNLSIEGKSSCGIAGDYTVAFLGTGDGHLKKVVIEGASSGIEYSDVVVSPNHSISSDIVFDLKREHLYVMSHKKLSKVKVQDCSVFATCGDCLGSKGE